MKKQNIAAAAAELKKTMKISKSKQELARIISENGGWPDGAHWMSQDRDGGVYSFAGGKPVKHKDMWCLKSSSEKIGWKFAHAGAIKNWHQTILSRDEYFHLYPVAEPALEPEAKARPTIEQLAADYRNAKDYAERKQQEADDAKADAEEKLKALELAGEALGILVSPITAKQEPELVITDWRDLRRDDVILCVGDALDGRIRTSFNLR